jgi:hypothetical protein
MKKGVLEILYFVLVAEILVLSTKLEIETSFLKNTISLYCMYSVFYFITLTNSEIYKHILF